MTLGQDKRQEIIDVIYKYSKNFLIGNHGGHLSPNGDDNEQLHHYHCIIMDITPTIVDAFKKAMCKAFGLKGNAFHAGKFMDNTVYKGIQYIKHDPNVEWSHRGGPWRDIIDDSPDWEEQRVSKKAKVEVEKLAYPTISYYNVLKQAWKHREEYKLKTDDLGQVLDHMTQHTNWQPDIKIMRTGLDEMHFKLFRYKCNGKVGPAPNWWRPKQESHF